jgi:hypothetical protein
MTDCSNSANAKGDAGVRSAEFVDKRQDQSSQIRRFRCARIRHRFEFQTAAGCLPVNAVHLFNRASRSIFNTKCSKSWLWVTFMVAPGDTICD